MIRRVVLAPTLALCLFMASWGTSPASVGVSGGVKIGGGTTELTDLPLRSCPPADSTCSSTELGSGTGVIAGVFATFRISGLLAFQAEGLYAQKGAKDLVAHYLEFPMLARLDVSLGGLGLYAIGGPSFAFLQNCGDCNGYVWWLEDGEASLIPKDYLTDSNVDPNDPRIIVDGLNLKSTSIEAVLGAGVSISLAGGAIGVEGRYQRSLGDLNAHTNPALTDIAFKSEGISVLVSYSRRFGGDDQADGETEEP